MKFFTLICRVDKMTSRSRIKHMQKSKNKDLRNFIQSKIKFFGLMLKMISNYRKSFMCRDNVSPFWHHFCKNYTEKTKFTLSIIEKNDPYFLTMQHTNLFETTAVLQQKWRSPGKMIEQIKSCSKSYLSRELFQSLKS